MKKTIYYYVVDLDFESRSLEKCLKHLRKYYNDIFDGEQILSKSKIEKYLGSGNTDGDLEFKETELALINYYYALIDDDNLKNFEICEQEEIAYDDLRSEYLSNLI